MVPSIELYRADLAELVRLAESDLAELWTQVNDARIARELLADVLPSLVDVYGSAAATLAADWYDEARIEAEVAGRFRAITGELPTAGRTEALAGWAVEPLRAVEPDPATALTKAQGGLQRIVANAGRDTITRSSVADPGARGWQRTGVGECAFCQMLISRGTVYTRRTADFGAHDHCKCAAVPAWGGQPLPVKPYVPTQRNISDADRARVRRWLAANG